jgi:PEP-CTERM motif-containing protein
LSLASFTFAAESPAPTPEPASAILLGSALAGLGARRWWRNV